MVIIRKYVESFSESVLTTFEESSVNDMKPHVARLFAAILDRRGMREEVEKIVASSMKNQLCAALSTRTRV